MRLRAQLPVYQSYIRKISVNISLYQSKVVSTYQYRMLILFKVYQYISNKNFNAISNISNIFFDRYQQISTISLTDIRWNRLISMNISIYQYISIYINIYQYYILYINACSNANYINQFQITSIYINIYQTCDKLYKHISNIWSYYINLYQSSHFYIMQI